MERGAGGHQPKAMSTTPAPADSVPRRRFTRSAGSKPRDAPRASLVAQMLRSLGGRAAVAPGRTGTVEAARQALERPPAPTR